MSRRSLVSAVTLAAFIAAGCSPAPESGAPTAAPPAAASASSVAITLTTEPDPPATGDVRFTAAVAASDGQPIADAIVEVELYMAAMPSMNMPEMRHRTALPATGDGRYSGTAQVMMAGPWDVTVTVARDGREIGRRTFAVRAN